MRERKLSEVRNRKAATSRQPPWVVYQESKWYVSKTQKSLIQVMHLGFLE